MNIISNNKNDKVMAFIDLRNVDASVKKDMSCPFRIDYPSLITNLVGNRNLVGAYVFDGINDKMDPKLERFHNYLRENGFRLITKESIENGEQKEIDVAMACEMVKHAMQDDYNVAIVITGDRDFVPAIQCVQGVGKIVETAGFKVSTSKEITHNSDRHTVLDDMPILRMYNPENESVQQNNTKSNSSQEITVNRIGPDMISSENFTESKYYVHLSADRKILTVHPSEKGNIKCIDNTIKLDHLSYISKYTEPCVMDSQYNPKIRCVEIYLN